jgi:hypothetical protein
MAFPWKHYPCAARSLRLTTDDEESNWSMIARAISGIASVYDAVYGEDCYAMSLGTLGGEICNWNENK